LKVLIITGSYPPDKCGVGDYSFHLAHSLFANNEIEVAVLTSASNTEDISDPDIKVFRNMSKWGNKNLFELKNVISEFLPDIVHIQYPTQGYLGNPPRLMPVFLKLLGVPVVQTWHEYYHQSGVKWQNLLACNALVYVRPDFPKKIPYWVNKLLAHTPQFYIANTSTIPSINLNDAQLREIKQNLSGGKPIVSFFGFAHANKGMELIFEIADPLEHHLVLICDLNSNNTYQAHILSLASQPSWKDNVTITGFVPTKRVSEILSVSDAVLFPFPDGAGEWNTSLKASEASGAFSLATTKDTSLIGYDETKNTYFAGCGQISEMRNALKKYLGRRIQPDKQSKWEEIALAHVNIYKQLIK
jgi:glycosyltransferase involved in cell wall biosynthesis